MFLGEYRHTLDSKDRLTVPVKFREVLGVSMYFIQGFDHNLMAMSNAAFEKVLQRMQELNIADPDARLLLRRLLGSATQVDVDRSGRVLIPAYLRNRISLKSELVLIGQGEYFEIWTPEEWARQEAAQLDAEANNQRFKVLDLRLGAK